MLKSRIKTVIKRYLRTSTLEEKRRLLKEAYSLIDKGVKKGILHKNKAARKKRNLALLIKEAEGNQKGT